MWWMPAMSRMVGSSLQFQIYEGKSSHSGRESTSSGRAMGDSGYI